MSVRIMIFYTAIKQKDILIFVTKYMNLENIVISKISQTLKDKHLHVESTKDKFLD